MTTDDVLAGFPAALRGGVLKDYQKWRNAHNKSVSLSEWLHYCHLESDCPNLFVAMKALQREEYMRELFTEVWSVR